MRHRTRDRILFLVACAGTAAFVVLPGLGHPVAALLVAAGTIIYCLAIITSGL